ncbi:MAG: hypothetical protein K6T90_04775 [Leptolyngbyaceae cyanobacterium HOT.MB2.61]|nr:hypothetical protein [Leptolyngbyaceae cyanobacterium HOT.MB2.61]
MMRRILQKWQIDLVRKYGKFAVFAGLVVAGLAVKPATISIARLPEALSGNEAKVSQATADARSQQRQEQIRQVRPENYDLARFPVTNQNEKHWRNILWTTAVVEPQESFVAEAIDQILRMTTLPGLSNSQMRTIDAATKVATQLYLRYPSFYGRFEQRFLQAIESSPDPEWVAVSLSVLVRSGASPGQLQSLTERVKSRFPNWTKNVHLYTSVREVSESIAPSTLPPLGDLLNWAIAPRQLHLYVLCRPKRDILCQAILKDRDGQFVRYGDGNLWSVPLLLRSIHELNWNFVRGQTPQGIFRLEGVVPQPDDEYFRAYGRFSLVKLFVPFEPGAKQFLPGKAGAFRGSLKDYQNLLPSSWRNYWPIQQSYWAGKVGRSEFRIHGTGESPDFFSNKGSNPNAFSWNPTIGCLSALELYNEKGQLVEAHMPKILDALQMVGGKNFAGYMVVVEVPGKTEQPITLKEIEAAILNGKGATSASSTSKYLRQKAQSNPKSATKSVSKTLELKPILEKTDSKAAEDTVPIAQPIVQSDSASFPSSDPPVAEPRSDESMTPLPMAY